MKERQKSSPKLGDHESLLETLWIQQRPLDDFHQDFVIPFVGILGVHNLRIRARYQHR